MHLRLPGRCATCGGAIVFDGKRWVDRPRVVHVCPVERPTCGELMRYAKERCARTPGHRFEHRSRYAMDNARRMATGRG
jgi:hypothetical protein